MNRNKPIYAISIVSEILGLHPQTLRQYERMGLIVPSRTMGNTRLYSDEDLERLRFITELTKDIGVNLAGVEIIMQMRDEIASLNGTINALQQHIKLTYGEELSQKQEQLTYGMQFRKIHIESE